MADDDSKIVVPIELQVDEASAQAAADSVQRSIEAAAKRINITPEEFTARHDATRAAQVQAAADASRPKAESKAPPNLEAAALGETNSDIGRSAEAIRIFREALHVLHPALEEAGISAGGMTSLVRAATGGIVALALAVGGVLVTSLEKAADAANDAASRLGSFTGSLSSGQDTYEKLGSVAEKSGTATTSLAVPFEQLTRVNQQQSAGDRASNEQLLSVLGNIAKGGESERADPTKVLAEFTKILEGIREKGFLAPDDLKALESIAPKTAAAIISQLPKGQDTYTGAQFIGAAQRAGPQIDANTIEAGVLPTSISTAWEHVKASYERLAEATSGGHLISSSLDSTATFMENLAGRIKKLSGVIDTVRTTRENSSKDTVKTLADAQSNPDQNEGSRQYDQVLKQPQNPFIEATNQSAKDQQGIVTAPKSLDAFDAENTGKLAAEAAKLGDAAGKAATPVEALQKEFDKLSVTAQKQLEARSSQLKLRKDAIDAEFEPKETANKLARDEVAEENASNRVEQAKIAATEAQKAVELAHLAPAAAQQNLNNATNNRDQLYAKFFKEHGIDTSQLEQVNAQKKQLDDLDAADLAVKRAGIEKKYSYLDEPKAKLAAERAQTDIRSAQIEANSTHLTHAKDAAGAPISHDLQMIQYAQDEIDAHKKELELLNTGNKTLEQILNAIQKNTNNDDKNLHASGDASSSGTSSGSAGGSGGNQASSIPTSYTDKSGQRIELGPGAEAPGYNPNTGAGTSNGVHGYIDPSTGKFQPGDAHQGSGTVDGVHGHYDDKNKFIPDTGGRDGVNKNDDVSLPDNNKDEQKKSVGRKGHYDPETGQFVLDEYAKGGPIRGPGTGTSDSIPILASNDEYMHTEKAHKFWGTDFMDAINNMEVPKFASGGGISLARYTSSNILMPSGEASRHLIDLRTDHGTVRDLRGNDDSIGQLRRAALQRASVRTGKSQSWDR